jgi:hypothetical protein
MDEIKLVLASVARRSPFRRLWGRLVLVLLLLLVHTEKGYPPPNKRKSEDGEVRLLLFES